MDRNKTYYSPCVTELSPNSREANIIQNKINESVISKHTYFSQNWNLQKIFNIENKAFNVEFNEKQADIENNSCIFNQWEVRYGFLTTIKESMIHKVADEGLEVRLCPYNYFGHSVSGIHISQHPDVCMNEALSKIGSDDEIILITFKYMLGRHKSVPMYDPDILLAPSPKYDSHICIERPNPIENINDQYIKSLVYLYEFANPNFDPVIRPRHCCPVSALIYKQAKQYGAIDLTGNGSIHSRMLINSDRQLSLLKPSSQKNWNREFILNAPLPTSSLMNQKYDRADTRKVIATKYEGDGIQANRSHIDNRSERWDPIRREKDDIIPNRRSLDERVDRWEEIVREKDKVMQNRSVEQDADRWAPIRYEYYDPNNADDNDVIIFGDDDGRTVRTTRSVTRRSREMVPDMKGSTGGMSQSRGHDYPERDRSFDRLERIADISRYSSIISEYDTGFTVKNPSNNWHR